MEARRFLTTAQTTFLQPSFYEEVITKMLAKFPFNDQTLKAFSYLNPEKRFVISVEDVLQQSYRLVIFTQEERPLHVFWVDMSSFHTLEET
ncbi:hypothetical protein ACJMK2_039330 [Sinanodonta woodiana]|uniref:Uncharacterized protein n=1 Tax=Sinanodonta woodiana TaxID=1069815 RepID=A0ABD3WDN5_SINWO